MSKFLTAGIIQKETIVKVNKLPIKYSPVINALETIFSDIGGDAFNMMAALEWLGDEVDFFSMVGKDDSYLIEKENLNPQLILPKLIETPAAVVLYDESRKQQMFEDIKDLRYVSYEIELFQERLATTDMVILSNANFCRPFVKLTKEAKIPLAVNFHDYHPKKMKYNIDFYEAADIIYLSDSTIKGEPYEFVHQLALDFPAKCIILGMGKQGLLMYTREDNLVVPYDSVHIKHIKNTVGAGNALFSCFLHYYMKKGDFHEAIKYALLFAAYKIGYVGTSKGFMTESEMSQWYDLIWNSYH